MFPRTESNNYQMLDTPWMRKHVEGHLIIGLLWSRSKPFWIIGLFVCYLCIRGVAMHTSLDQITKYLLNIQHLFVFACLVYLGYFLNYYRSALYWCAVKVSLLFIGFIFVFGGIVNNLRGIDNSLYLSLLG